MYLIVDYKLLILFLAILGTQTTEATLEIGPDHPYRYPGNTMMFRRIESIIHSIWHVNSIWNISNNNLLWLFPALHTIDVTELEKDGKINDVRTLMNFLNDHVEED
ncbi:hypothetical protein L9F63_007850, partial [Diploptera punctata]